MNNSTNNNRWLTILILVLLTANIATLALLWINKGKDKGERRPPQEGGQVFEFLSNELKLDSAQRTAYAKLRDEHQAGARPLQDSIRKAKDAFFALLQQSNIPDSTLTAASKKASDAVQQLDMFTFRHFQKVRAICNADQQKRFDELIQDVLRRMTGPRRQGPPPGREGDFPPPPPGTDHPGPPEH